MSTLKQTIENGFIIYKYEKYIIKNYRAFHILPQIYILKITQPFHYRCTQWQYIFAVISEAPGIYTRPPIVITHSFWISFSGWKLIEKIICIWYSWILIPRLISMHLDFKTMKTLFSKKLFPFTGTVQQFYVGGGVSCPGILRFILSVFFFISVVPGQAWYLLSPNLFIFDWICIFNTSKVGNVMCVFDRKIMPHWV